MTALRIISARTGSRPAFRADEPKFPFPCTCFCLSVGLSGLPPSPPSESRVPSAQHYPELPPSSLPWTSLALSRRALSIRWDSGHRAISLRETHATASHRIASQSHRVASVSSPLSLPPTPLPLELAGRLGLRAPRGSCTTAATLRREVLASCATRTRMMASTSAPTRTTTTRTIWSRCGLGSASGPYLFRTFNLLPFSLVSSFLRPASGPCCSPFVPPAPPSSTLAWSCILATQSWCLPSVRRRLAAHLAPRVLFTRTPSPSPSSGHPRRLPPHSPCRPAAISSRLRCHASVFSCAVPRPASYHHTPP